MKKLAPLALIAALALAGCAPKALEVTPAPAMTPVEKQHSGSTNMDSASESWEKAIFNEWLKAEGVKGEKSKIWPFSLIASYEETAPGELTVYVTNGILNEPEQDVWDYDPDVPLNTIARSIMSATGANHPELRRLFVTSEDGSFIVSLPNYATT